MVGTYCCDRLFTWATDQPRHAAGTSTCPVEASSPPKCSNVLLLSYRPAAPKTTTAASFSPVSRSGSPSDKASRPFPPLHAMFPSRPRVLPWGTIFRTSDRRPRFTAGLSCRGPCGSRGRRRTPRPSSTYTLRTRRRYRETRPGRRVQRRPTARGMTPIPRAADDSPGR